MCVASSLERETKSLFLLSILCLLLCLVSSLFSSSNITMPSQPEAPHQKSAFDKLKNWAVKGLSKPKQKAVETGRTMKPTKSKNLLPELSGIRGTASRDYSQGSCSMRSSMVGEGSMHGDSAESLERESEWVDPTAAPPAEALKIWASPPAEAQIGGLAPPAEAQKGGPAP